MLFSRRDDRRMRIVLLTVALVGLGAIASPMVWVRSSANTRQHAQVEQPVMFDHRHHVLDVGIDCRFCHSLAFESSVAGVPPATLCMQCHNQVWSDAPTLAPVRAAAASGDPIHWSRVHRLPEHVFFNHAAHTRQGVPCAACHGAVETMAAVWQEAPLTMAWCLDCHRNPTPQLRPRDHVTDPFWRTAQQGTERAAVATVAPPVNCSGCHR